MQYYYENSSIFVKCSHAASSLHLRPKDRTTHPLLHLCLHCRDVAQRVPRQSRQAVVSSRISRSSCLFARKNRVCDIYPTTDIVVDLDCARPQTSCILLTTTPDPASSGVAVIRNSSGPRMTWPANHGRANICFNDASI